MRKKKVIWFHLSRQLICLVILGFGVLGLILSLSQVKPILAVSGGRVGLFMQMLLDMQNFARLGF